MQGNIIVSRKRRGMSQDSAKDEQLDLDPFVPCLRKCTAATVLSLFCRTGILVRQLALERKENSCTLNKISLLFALHPVRKLP